MANTKRKCKHCKEYQPVEEMVKLPAGWFCSTAAGIKFAMEKTKAVKSKAFTKQCNADRKKAKENTKGYQAKKAQDSFNRVMRALDIGQPCVSCQTPYNQIKKKNAGHYRSVGAAPHLRFNEDNVWLQCEHCNTHKSGNAVEYRINLIKRIGVERVEALEADNTPVQYRIDDYKAIRLKYNLKFKELEE
jgi:hypothetical protein